MIKNYRFGIEIWGLLLFLLIMVPNFIWFAVPAPNDILRSESVTPQIDMLGSFCQVIFVATLCMVKRKAVEKLKVSPLIIMVLVSVALYFII